MTILKRIWTFFADLSGVIATVGYAIIGISYLWGWLFEHKKLLLLFLFILPFVVIAAIKWISSSFKKFSRNITDIDINEEINQFKKIKPNQDINKILPSNSLLSKLVNSLARKVKNWADDGKMDTLTMYLKVESKKIDISLQAHCKSQWKSEEANIYAGKNYGVSAREVSATHAFASQDIVIFSKKYSNWRKAIIKAYEAIKDKLPNDFRLIACSHYTNSFHFEFIYTSGIERAEEFELKDNMLKNLKSGKTVVI